MGFTLGVKRQRGGLQERFRATLTKTASCRAQADGWIYSDLCLPCPYEGSYYPGTDREKGQSLENTSSRHARLPAHAVHSRKGSPLVQEWESETETISQMATPQAVRQPAQSQAAHPAFNTQSLGSQSAGDRPPGVDHAAHGCGGRGCSCRHPSWERNACFLPMCRSIGVSAGGGLMRRPPSPRLSPNALRRSRIENHCRHRLSNVYAMSELGQRLLGLLTGFYEERQTPLPCRLVIQSKTV